MATQLAAAELPVIRAAGGIILRDSPGGDEVMIVFRARHQDWTLPKGKVKDGESFHDAAVREVEEETGCRCELGSYLGMISYAHQGIPKVVMFWKMSMVEEKPRADDGEITEALWLPVSAAIQCLTYSQEKALLSLVQQQNSRRSVAGDEAAGDQKEVELEQSSSTESEPEAFLTNGSAGPSSALEAPSEPASEPVLVPAPDQFSSEIAEHEAEPAITDRSREAEPAKTAESSPEPEKRSFSRLPRRIRGRRSLEQEIKAFRVELAFLAGRDGSSHSWTAAAEEHVSHALEHLEDKDLESARSALQAGRRYAVLGLNPPELAARAQVLRDEAMQMFTWRGAAIQRLLATADDRITPARVSDAMHLRDEDDAEQSHRAREVSLRLRLLLLLCTLGALTLTISLYVVSFGDYQAYVPVAFAGLLGAALAAAQYIYAKQDEGKIPGLILTLALVIVSSPAALAADPIYGLVSYYLKLHHQYDLVLYTLALLLGYGAERLLSRFAGFSRDLMWSGA